MNLLHFNSFWDGKVLGTYNGTSLAQTNWDFTLNDWLGTKPVITNSDGGYSTSFLCATDPLIPTVIFTGDMSYFPNQEAVISFTQERCCRSCGDRSRMCDF